MGIEAGGVCRTYRDPAAVHVAADIQTYSVVATPPLVLLNSEPMLPEVQSEAAGVPDALNQHIRPPAKQAAVIDELPIMIVLLAAACAL